MNKNAQLSPRAYQAATLCAEISAAILTKGRARCAAKKQAATSRAVAAEAALSAMYA
jgi:hypothetical protein